MKRRTWTVALVILLGGLWRIAGAVEEPAEKPAAKETVGRIANPSPKAGKPAAEPAPAPKVVYLEKCRGWGLMPAEMVHQGILAQELFRQALLIAARDELGLRTRDAWLGDAMPEGGDNPPLDIAAGPGQRTLIEYLRGFYPVQEIIARDWHESKGPLDYVALAVDREKASRTTLVAVLKQAGFEGKPNARKPDAKVPEKVQQLLGEMTFTSQFDAVRRLHAAIRADGESPARLGALARAYANLGILTEVYWHPAHKVFKARAMLYAQRLPAAEEEPSPGALWHRAYVLTLVGLHKQALAELETAEKAWKEAGEKDEKKRPGWVDLLGSFCRYDLQKLAPNQTTEANRELSWLLRFVATEQSGILQKSYQRHIIQAGMEAAEALPECYRVLDGLARWTGVGLGHSTTMASTATMAQHLYGRVAAIPGLPQTARLICARQGAGGGLLGALVGRREETSLPEEFKARGQLMRALAAVGKPSIDRGEPSWAALGLVIQEASFLQVYRRARFERRSLGVSPDEFLQAAAPLAAEHRYRVALDGFAWDERQRREALRKLSRMALEGLESHGQQLVDQFVDVHKPEWESHVNSAWAHTDGVVRDLTIRLPLAPDAAIPETARRLEAVSPHCPAARAALIARDWKSVAGKAAQWEKEAAHYPTVLIALGKRYVAMNRPDDAARCLSAAVKLAPEMNTYKALAEIYRKQGDEEKWLATLEEYLKQPAYDLSQARMREQIARHFMQRRQFDKALPYAAAAAGTYSGWGLLCAGECHEAMGRWETAERCFQAVSGRYRNSMMLWYFYCRRTGHGDLEGARELARQAVQNAQAIGSEDLNSQIRFFHCLEGQPENALKLAEKDLAGRGDPVSGLNVVLLADELKHFQKRDAALEEIRKRGPHYVSIVTRRKRPEIVGLAAMIAKDLAAGGKGEIDLQAAEKLCAKAPRNDQQFFLWLLGKYLDLHGKPKEAENCWKQCLGTMESANLIPKTMAGAALVAHGLKADDFYKEIFQEKAPAGQSKDAAEKPR